ncbi:NUDIX hydrolase (macronuclear) [Tetrahymena thermophila SB210]|uniref:NUDIX hydrolase n=1 Tax=Tetrahymena thermophila (strain SB210) TaxID=312017 RepID=Q24D71_TETTS|nr:NUDIX hydrolase [Tetrahymena thermophila SB210]EAS05718.1 NUDIX hydrolase [Tetrahymena thermophila SB210]|eukprot:XP_001025963.1 NUDIX hydrolase [Tetrahymena thermophila SB210]
MQPQPQKTGLSALINGLQQSSSNQNLSIFQTLSQDNEHYNQNLSDKNINAQNQQDSNNEDDEEEAKSSSQQNSKSILFKPIKKKHKDFKNKNQMNNFNSESQKQNVIQDKITGAGVLLWEKFSLSEEEYMLKKEILKQEAVQKEGYTILLFGQKEKKGKFKDQILYTDPGGKIDNNESSQKIASRELFEESCGTFQIDEQYFDIKKSFRMGGSYILYNLNLESIGEKKIDLQKFNKNYDILQSNEQTPVFWLESLAITRIFADELKKIDLYENFHIINLTDAYGKEIQIGRRCIAILRALTKSPNVYNFQKSQLLINSKVQLYLEENNDENLLQIYPWLKDTLTYKSKQLN